MSNNPVSAWLNSNGLDGQRFQKYDDAFQKNFETLDDIVEVAQEFGIAAIFDVCGVSSLSDKAKLKKAIERLLAVPEAKSDRTQATRPEVEIVPQPEDMAGHLGVARAHGGAHECCATAQSIEGEVQTGELSKATSAPTLPEQGTREEAMRALRALAAPCSSDVGADIALLSSPLWTSPSID